MPSVSNLFEGGGLKWHPDADSVGAPQGVLLRADNLVPDRDGALSLRAGSVKTLSSLGSNVHSVYTTELDSTKYRALGVDDQLYINGTLEDAAVGGTSGNDIAMGDDAYQMFFARGSWRKKWDGTSLINWGINKPDGKPTLAAVASITSTIADFNNSESPATTVQEGSGAIGGATDQDGSANEATTITPDGSSYQAIIQRLWTSDQDFFTIAGVDGSETDLIDLYVKLEKPREVESVRLVFGLDASDTVPFKDNRLEFEFDIRNGIEVPLKDFEAEGYGAFDEAVKKTVTGVDPKERTGVRTPSQVKGVLANVGGKPAPKSSAPKDNVWGHLTVTRGQFERIGTEENRGWNTVRGFKLVYKTIKGKTSTLTISDAIVVGGGDRTLTGTYRCVVRGVRDQGSYYEFGPPSEESDSINLNHQTLQITIPGTLLNSLDSQVDQVWVYLFGGWLDAYYRFTVVGAQAKSGATLDELSTPDGTIDKDMRARITSWGGSLHNAAASSDLVLNLRTSELDALTENIRLEPYQIEVPNNIVDIAGPWRNRTFVLTSEGFVYPSYQNSPSGFNSLQMIDLSRYGDPKWMAKTGNGIYVGMEKDVIFLAGTGDESPDFASIDLFGQELNLGNPPVDGAHLVDGNTIFFRSVDGLMMLTGNSMQPVPAEGTSLLWRGQDRHDIKALNTTTGRFRMAIDNHIFYMLAPEGTDTTAGAMYRYSFPKQQWSRLLFNQAGSLLSVYTEYDGTLVMGDSSGNLWSLEQAGNLDAGNNMNFDLLTPIEDGGQPLTYKDPMDLQLHMNTGGDGVTVELYKDGANTSTVSLTGTTAVPTVWRGTTSSLGKFIKAQLGVTGSPSAFRLNRYDLSYRVRPQRMTYLDTGYFIGPGDSIDMQEIEVDAIAMNDFTVELWIEDKEITLGSEASVSATVGDRDVYQIPVPRGSKGENARVVIKSDTTSGNDVGFDPYRVRVRLNHTGNETGPQYQQVFPAGQAP